MIAAADADTIGVSAFVRTLLIAGLRVRSLIDAALTILAMTPATACSSCPGRAANAAAWRSRRLSANRLTPCSRAAAGVWAGLPASRRPPQLAAHLVRSTAITELFDAGVAMPEVQDFARRKDPRTTRRYDKRRGNLDRAGSYVLATWYRQRADDERPLGRQPGLLVMGAADRRGPRARPGQVGADTHAPADGRTAGQLRDE